MGKLEDTNGRQHLLATRNLIGRSRGADLLLSDPAVSGEHAVLWWDGACWRLRDLASRNGTTVDRSPVEPGDGVPLQVGSVLGFGASGDRWRLVSAAPPRPFARELETGHTVEATGELLVLPDAEAPALTIFRDIEGDWIAEESEHSSTVHDLETVATGSTLWRLYLPEPQPGTQQRVLHPTIETIGLEFEVSRDLEHVQLTAVHEGGRLDLKARAHNYPLYVLAQQRLRDREAHPDAPEETHGWVHQEELRRLLGGMDDGRINLAVFRARQQAADAGIEGAAGIVERRTANRQLRIGVGRISVRFV